MSDMRSDYDTRDSGRIGAAVIDMIRGAISCDNNLLERAANSIDLAVTYGNLPRRDEFVGTLYAALSYDILNERHKANNMYERIQHTMLPDLSHITLSRKLSEQLGRSMADVGLRKTEEFGAAFGAVRDHLNRISSEPGHLKIQDESMDDYTVLFSTLSVLDRFFTSVRDMDKDAMDAIRRESARILKDLDKFDPQPWMEVYSMLCMHLIRNVCDRAITNLEIPNEIKMNLARMGKTELWDSQQEAVRSGLLTGHNLLYLSQPGTGKSFMAYLAAGRLAGGKQMAYLVPLKSLACQVHTDLNSVLGSSYAIALSDRDNTVYDADMGSQNVIVATYEKMDALIRNGNVCPERVQTVIVDEAHNIGDSTRGMAIEMMLGRMMSCGSGTQLVLLSGLISDHSSKDLAEWIDAKPVRKLGQDENGADEMIYCDGTLHHRNGAIERLPLESKINSSAFQKRGNVTAHFARRAIAQGEPMLVSVTRRTDAAKLASLLKANVEKSAFLDPDVLNGLKCHKVEYRNAAERIKSIEPRLPKFATELAGMLDYGIAYHHAKLPAGYRKVIENAIRNKEVHVVVATPTFEAGVNLPLKTVLFFDPHRYDAAKKTIPIETSRYVNLAGRTGRPGYYPNGSVIVVALTAGEMEKYRTQFWESEPEDIQSSFSTAVAGDEAAASTLESQLLGYVTARNGSVSMDEIMKQISSTWYGRRSSGNRIADVRHLVMERLRKLAQYGFLINADEPFEATMLGRAVGVSMLLPSSMFNMINVMKHIRLWECDGRNLTDSILILAGLAEEVLVDKKAVEKIEVPDAIRSTVADIFQTCDMTGFGHDENSVMSVASCLHYWTESHQTEEIIEMCGEDAHQQSEAGLIEEGIAQEAHRVLVAMAGMTDHMAQDGWCPSEATDMLRDAIMETAEFCRYGSNNNIVLSLLTSGAPRMGRSSAIAIARHLQDSDKKEVGALTKEEFVGIFPDNAEIAESLYDEITTRS